MNHEELKEGIKDILSIVEVVPSELKTKCFEILLENLLTTSEQPQKETTSANNIHQQSDSSYKIPTNVKAFLRKHEITQEELDTIIMIENNEVHFIREPKHTAALRGQNEWALLIALRNGLLNNNMKADPEEIRSIVQEKGFYDRANFSKNFKTKKYEGYFKNPLEPQGEAQQLTKEGEVALAELIKSLVK